ncbi:MAG: glycosyltransferase [Candidatus Omnitrophica bacterium]|nr:glycosyltransferase [Candidatus Omnitrophota bacterium]MDD5352673.1 glycosyltransferase [Candidatus Omnitrophota bacterium]MDD5550272.1 glycosyltransferase [Candidatus Omnitrophota bacterium]
MNEPLISIIVPAYNSEKTIKKCIDSLLEIDYTNYEVFIVDDGSTDNTKNILSGYKDKITIIENKHFGPSRCRNIAASKAKSEFLAFTDSDCIVEKNWLKELSRGFINDKVAGTGGNQLSPQDETNFGKRVQQFFELAGFLGGYIKGKKNSDLSETGHNPSCNAMYRKDAFLGVGGFDEKLWPGEDVDLDYRLKLQGLMFMYNPKAIVYHYRPQSIRKLSIMMYRYGVMQGVLIKRYGFFRKAQVFPLFFLLMLVLLFINLKFLWFLALYYLFILVKTKSIVSSSFILIFSIISVLGWHIGFLRGILFKK